MIRTIFLEFDTEGEGDVLNITEDVKNVIGGSKLKEGFALLFLQSTTAALAIVEYEGGLLIDLQQAMERFAPKNAEYEHEKAYHDGNGHSHVRSSMLGTSLVVPFEGRKLLLGTWQQIVLAEFDVRKRRRSLVVQLHGD